MANVVQVGTPGAVQSQVGSNTPSVLGVWSGTQLRTAGDLLVACITTWGGTTVGTPTTATSGWTQSVIKASAGTHNVVSIWTKVATGSDTAPTFTVTNTGTATNSKLTVYLIELSSVDGVTPIQTTGNGDGVASPITITSAANVSRSGSYGITSVAESASTTVTGTYTKGAAWTNSFNDGATSLRSHSAADVIANPATGATLSEIATWSGGTVTDLVGVMIVVQPPTAGGTVFPIAGSSAASSTATGAATLVTGPVTYSIVGMADADTLNASGSVIIPGAINIIGTSSAGTGLTASTSLSVNNPVWIGGATAPGLLVLLWSGAVNTTSTFSCPGFTAVTVATGQNISQQLLYRVTDGSEGSTFSITNSTSTFFTIGAIAISGQGTGLFDPSVPSGSGQTLASLLTSLPATGLTTGTAKAMLIWLATARQAIGTPVPAITPPSGFTTALAQADSGSGATHANVDVYAASSIQTTAGATGTQTGTLASSANGGALLIAILSTAVAGPGTVTQLVSGAPVASGFGVIAKTAGATSCRLAISTSSSMTSTTYVAATTPDSLGYVRWTATGLSPATRYYVQVTDTPSGGTENLIGPIGSCKTLPAAGVPASFTVALASCTSKSDTGPPAQDVAIADWNSWNADLNIFTGDFDYSGTQSTVLNTQIAVYEDIIASVPNYGSLVAGHWGFYCRSDHEAGPDNGDSNNTYTATNIAAAQAVFPFGTLGDTGSPPRGLYQSWVAGRIRFIMVDVRNLDRSPGGNVDNSSKTMLGAAQLAWLQNQLIQSEQLKIIISDPGWMGAATISNGPDKWWSYDTERQAIISYINANIAQVKNVMLWHGDSHLIGYATAAKNTWGSFPVWCASPFLNTGGGLYTSTFSAFFNGPSPAECRQYGRITVTDTGGPISVLFQGWDAVTGTVKVSVTEVFQTTVAISGTSATSSSATGVISGMTLVSGSATTASSATGTVVMNVAVSGQSATVSAASGVIGRIFPIVGQSATAPQGSGAVVVTLLTSATSIASSIASGSLGKVSPVAGSASAASSASGAIVAILATSGSSGSASTATGSIGALGVLSGTAPVVSSTSGTIVATLVLSGSSTTSSTASGSLSRATPVSGSAATVSSAPGAVAITSGPQILSVAGSSISTSSAGGTVSLLAVLAGTSVGISAATGVLSTQGVLAGSAVSVSGATGSISLTGIVTGKATSVSAAAGSIVLTGVVAGSSTSISHGDGWLAGGPISGTAIALSSASGTISQRLALSGTSATSSQGSGAVTIIGLPPLVISALSVSVSTASGVVVTVMALSGTALSASSASGSLGLRGVITGTSGTVSVGLGAVVLVTRVSGSSTARSKADGYLADINRLTGLSITHSQADGWIGLPIIVGSLPDKITAIVYVSNVLAASIAVNSVAATVETSEISAEVT